MTDHLHLEAQRSALVDAKARAAYRLAKAGRGDVAATQAVAIAAAADAAIARKAYRIAAEAANVRSFITIT